ncbi:MAG: NAD-dependent epimerase/dehydratase family protein [Polyangiaceae bacterium]|nr:NAD-dependent epimerase/dehydratase family protein [Polyangiaceae bacterium]
MKVFITGGSGFVGGHAIEALVREGHEVSALARSAEAADRVRSYGASPVSGSLGAIDAALLKGNDAVVHAAAYVEEWGTREQFWKANVEGTQNLLDASKEAGVRRFVHVGTEAAVFSGEDLVDIDESFPYPESQKYLYSETKAEAERRVLSANSTALETISIRPRFVWGPRDTSVLPAIVKMAKAGRFAWLDQGHKRTSTTHVANLVHALVLALDHGTPGRAYFVADDGTRTLREFLTALAGTQGVDLGTRNMPSAVARPLARVVETTWRTLRLRGAPPIVRFSVDMMSSAVTVKTDRARKELGWAPVIGVDQGLAAMKA